jgi:hypothetical protein
MVKLRAFGIGSIGSADGNGQAIYTASDSCTGITAKGVEIGYGRDGQSRFT